MVVTCAVRVLDKMKHLSWLVLHAVIPLWRWRECLLEFLHLLLL